MTLRSRLLLAFVLIVLLPVAVGAALVAHGVPAALRTQVDRRLQTAGAGAVALVDELCRNAQFAADSLARQTAGSRPANAVRDVVRRGLVAGAQVSSPAGRVLAASGVPIAGSGTGCRAEPAAAGGQMTGAVALRAGRRRLGRVAVALPLRPLTGFVRGGGTDVTLAAAGRVLASSLPPTGADRLVAAARPLAADRGARAVGTRRVVARAASGGVLVLVSAAAPSTGALEGLLVAITLVALALAVLIGWQLARVTTRPIAELSDVAARVAEGDLEAHIEPHGADEVGRLATALSGMTDHLRDYIGELEHSRDELRRSLGRLGETLSGTHDLNRILEVILETAMATAGASAGAVMLCAPKRGDLYLKVGRGLTERGVGPRMRVDLGAGVAGRVAKTGRPVAGRIGEDGLSPAPGEPVAEQVLAAPLRVGGKVAGVLLVYDRYDRREFDEGDLQTLSSFAGQATVAIDNVLLHQEAQRLSITDELTGLPNLRHFQLNFGKEVERAARFGRPLGVLMVDIDHFKQVNDEHGHRRGDAVLVELGQRMKAQIREVDMLARYGGEEFVAFLPETNRSGAVRTAERIRTAVADAPFGGANGSALHITVSVGVAVFPNHADSATGVLAAADDAMYAAKRAGRDRVSVAATREDASGSPG